MKENRSIAKTSDDLIVKLEQAYHEEIEYGELKLQIDPLFRKWENAVRQGEVISVPKVNRYGIENEVNPGDTIFFHYNVVDECSENEIEINEEIYYKVPYIHVFCVLKDDDIKMIGGRVFCEPIYDDDIEMVDGMLVKKQGGIITEVNVGHNSKKARVAYIGSPSKGSSKLDVKPGDVIFYEKNADFENTVNGKTYFCMKQDDIICVVD